jgi:hypothetical protein
MTPSPVQSNSEDQINQQFAISSPNTEPTPIQTLMDVMMGELLKLYKLTRLLASAQKTMHELLMLTIGH